MGIKIGKSSKFKAQFDQRRMDNLNYFIRLDHGFAYFENTRPSFEQNTP